MTVSSASLESIVTQVRSNLGWAALPDWGLIEISGADAAEFLQSQTSNDILQLAEGAGQLNALLDRKAHVQSFFSLHRWQNRYWVLIEQSQIPATLARLETFHFSEDVHFTDVSDAWDLWTLQGPDAVPVLEALLEQRLPPEAAQENAVWPVTWAGQQGLVFRRSLTGEIGFCVAMPKMASFCITDALTRLNRSTPVVEISREALNILRLEAGQPKYGVDMDDTVILPATGLERVAVSYSKGCYQGQEVVAKVKTYGSVGKALVGLVFQDPDVPLPPRDTPVTVNGQPLGTFKSSGFSPTLKAPIAMAYLGREERVPGKVLSVALQNGVWAAKVVFLPFYTGVEQTQRARTKYDEGLAAFANNQDATAIHLLREAIALDPHLADAYEALGVILSRHEDYDEAIALMQQLAELEPEAVMPHTNLSVFYMKLGMKEEAEVEKAKATTLQFQQAMKVKMGEKAQAEEAARQRQALEEKVVMFQEVLALDAEDALASYGLGNTMLQLQRFDEALPHLDKALALDPRYTVAYLARGKVLEGLGQPGEAAKAYRQGIEVAAKRGDLMPMQEMQRRLAVLEG